MWTITLTNRDVFNGHLATFNTLSHPKTSSYFIRFNFCSCCHGYQDYTLFPSLLFSLQKILNIYPLKR